MRNPSSKSRSEDRPSRSRSAALPGPAGALPDPGQFSAGEAVAFWLMATNLFLVIFNMIPGYPLDGGRILRALLWAHSGKLHRATFITSRIGIGFAWVLAAYGMIQLVEKQWNGFVMMVIALFLRPAAETGYQ